MCRRVGREETERKHRVVVGRFLKAPLVRVVARSMQIQGRQMEGEHFVRSVEDIEWFAAV